MKKIMMVFGTRPEAIKMVPIIKEIEKEKEYFELKIISTGQHKEMLDQVINKFNLKIDYNLKIMKEKQSLTDMTANMLPKIEKIIKKENPDIILVHGDTTTTFVASLAAFYNKVKIGHVEAGLRTGNKLSPFPEEMNRVLTSNMADLHFAPTEMAKENLIKENKNEKGIFVTGNTVIDCLKYTVKESYKNKFLEKNSSEEKIVLLTTHRRENQGKIMEEIFDAINEITKKERKIKIIFPVHLNPYIQKLTQEKFKNNKKVKLIKPLDVEEFHNFINKVDLVLTDSGGLQEEAPSLNKPVLVLRDTTERPEGLIAGTIKLIGTKKENIIKETLNLLNNHEEYMKMANAINPYGDGEAAKKIINILKAQI